MKVMIFEALVDTESSYCVVERSMAEELGLPMNRLMSLIYLMKI